MTKVSYDKLKHMMIDRRLEWKDLKTIFSFSPHTIIKLKNDQVVQMDVLLKICDYFKCDISDIMQVIYYDEDNLNL